MIANAWYREPATMSTHNQKNPGTPRVFAPESWGNVRLYRIPTAPMALIIILILALNLILVPLDRGAEHSERRESLRRAFSAWRHGPSMSRHREPSRDRDRCEETKQRQELRLERFARKSLQEREWKLPVIERRHEARPGRHPECRLREDISPELLPACDRPAVSAEELLELTHARRRRPLLHRGHQDNNDPEVDFRSEETD